MLENLRKCLETKIATQANLVQLRGQKRTIITCMVKNGVIEEFSNVALGGVGARVLVDNKSWGFSSTSMVDASNLEKTLVNAVKLAKSSSKLKKQQIRLASAKTVKADITLNAKKPLQNFSADDIAEIPLDACKGAREVGQRIAEAKATYISIADDKYFLSTEGAEIHQNITRVVLYVDIIAKGNNTICPASESLGHAGGLELFDKTSPYALGKTTAEKAARLLNAKAPPSGKFRVVVHPTLCATLLHEAIGHPLEADLAMSGGGFGNQIGKFVSSKLVTIYDDGRVEGGLGYFPYDDEGVECKHTVLIENGVLRSFMHDRTSAALSSVSPTGNAHAWDYSVEPLIRQTNIGIEAGDYAEEELIEDVKEGLFLEGTFGGQADVNADFTFGFQSAKRINHGKLTEELRGANVAGNAIEVFKTIDAVGKDAVLRPGACGKFQFAIQGRVVPAIRCEIMVGGMGE
ncbi:MAG: TldD/PmbA family protein [Candidatus Bathyarchaeia archaeon]|nr:TldD/PmbA family protein [Candidatus Bathyarchaeota archaeon A05DMB-4]MDH7594696.1 TldD/PmbA family protein [Candidatus Bathyarchaeota archaeon]